MHNIKGEREKVIESLFSSTPWKNLSFARTFDPEERGKNWNRSSSKGIRGPWEDLPKEQEMLEIDYDFQMRPYYCFVEWLTTYNNLDEYALKLHSDDGIDLPLSKFSLYFSFRFIVLRINIISRWDKHSCTRWGNIRRREIIPQTDFVRSSFLKT